MYICIILCQGQKMLVPCEHTIMSDTLKGLKHHHYKPKTGNQYFKVGGLCVSCLFHSFISSFWVV